MATVPLIGLTGGIGSGKTAVARLFSSEQGIPVIDTDDIARMLTLKGGRAIEPIQKAFGSETLDADGNMDRTYMRKMVFSELEKKRELESILHPLIASETEDQIKRLESGSVLPPYIILVIPLLFETHWFKERLGRILSVITEPESQIERVMKRSQLSRAEVLSVLNTQKTNDVRIAQSDDIIINTGALEALLPQVSQLDAFYRKLFDNPIQKDYSA